MYQCSQTEFWIIICKAYLQDTDFTGENNCSQIIAPQELQPVLNLLDLQIATVRGSVQRGLCSKCLACQSAEM